MSEEEIEKLRKELNLGEKDIITDDGEVIRWDDLTFDDIEPVKKPETVE